MGAGKINNQCTAYCRLLHNDTPNVTPSPPQAVGRALLHYNTRSKNVKRTRLRTCALKGWDSYLCHLSVCSIEHKNCRAKLEEFRLWREIFNYLKNITCSIRLRVRSCSSSHRGFNCMPGPERIVSAASCGDTVRTHKAAQHADREFKTHCKHATGVCFASSVIMKQAQSGEVVEVMCDSW